jgi:hypothetical protein
VPLESGPSGTFAADEVQVQKAEERESELGRSAGAGPTPATQDEGKAKKVDKQELKELKKKEKLEKKEQKKREKLEKKELKEKEKLEKKEKKLKEKKAKV